MWCYSLTHKHVTRLSKDWSCDAVHHYSEPPHHDPIRRWWCDREGNRLETWELGHLQRSHGKKGDWKARVSCSLAAKVVSMLLVFFIFGRAEGWLWVKIECALSFLATHPRSKIRRCWPSRFILTRPSLASSCHPKSLCCWPRASPRSPSAAVAWADEVSRMRSAAPALRVTIVTEQWECDMAVEVGWFAQFAAELVAVFVDWSSCKFSKLHEILRKQSNPSKVNQFQPTFTDHSSIHSMCKFPCQSAATVDFLRESTAPGVSALEIIEVGHGGTIDFDTSDQY